MKALFAILSLLLFFVSTTAFADCVMDGQKYRTGERVGPYTCMPDGRWRR